MDNFNYEDMLKKALEESLEDHSNQEDMNSDEEKEITSVMGILGMSSMLNLGKAAKEKLSETLHGLIRDLNESAKLNEPAFHAHATVQIAAAAEKIRVLNTIISASAISGIDTLSEKKSDAKETLDLIMKLNSMR